MTTFQFIWLTVLSGYAVVSVIDLLKLVKRQQAQLDRIERLLSGRVGK